MEAQVPKSPREVCPLLAGMEIPFATVTAEDTSELNLSGAVRKKPTVVAFYRGSWCPHCNRKLGQLREIEAQIEKAGFKRAAIALETPDTMKTTKARYSVRARFLSDSQMRAARAFRIAYDVDQATLAQLKSHCVSLEAASG